MSRKRKERKSATKKSFPIPFIPSVPISSSEEKITNEEAAAVGLYLYETLDIEQSQTTVWSIAGRIRATEKRPFLSVISCNKRPPR